MWKLIACIHFRTILRNTTAIAAYPTCCALSLSRTSHTSSPFTEDEVRFFAAEVLLGVKYLHEHGIMHR